jgi:hypothetical protein
LRIHAEQISYSGAIPNPFALALLKNTFTHRLAVFQLISHTLEQQRLGVVLQSQDQTPQHLSFVSRDFRDPAKECSVLSWALPDATKDQGVHLWSLVSETCHAMQVPWSPRASTAVG